MSPQEYSALHILHVASVLILFGFTFYAFAAPAESRKRVMIWTGVANLIILLSGVRMWQALYGFAPLGWIMLAALAGLAYRRREKVGAWTWLAIVIGVIAAVMVYVQPF